MSEGCWTVVVIVKGAYSHVMEIALDFNLADGSFAEARIIPKIEGVELGDKLYRTMDGWVKAGGRDE
jgi:hypothetical protein